MSDSAVSTGTADTPLEPTALPPVEIPEATCPAPVLVLYARVTENRAADDYDGGLLVFQAIRGQLPEIAPSIADARLGISATHDAFLHQWPWRSRAARQSRYFRITVEEVPFDEVPPDPNPPTRAGGET